NVEQDRGNIVQHPCANRIPRLKLMLATHADKILWATSRLHVDDAAIARASSCPEQKTRWNAAQDVLTTLAFFARTKDDDGHPKVY
ncbi:hypothetical protein AVEN_260250-1, partial [Araneus ventricosus]